MGRAELSRQVTAGLLGMDSDLLSEALLWAVHKLVCWDHRAWVWELGLVSLFLRWEITPRGVARGLYATAWVKHGRPGPCEWNQSQLLPSEVLSLTSVTPWEVEQGAPQVSLPQNMKSQPEAGSPGRDFP